MIKKYWFGQGVQNGFEVITSSKIEKDFKKIQTEMKSSDEIIFGFNWNNDTNYVPFEFKKWIDKVIEYGVYNEGLKAKIEIYNGDITKEIYITSIIKSLEFIKAIVTIKWK